MKQGDVYWHTFRAPDKRRPVLILTRDSAISFLTSITVAPITTTIRGITSEVALTAESIGQILDSHPRPTKEAVLAALDLANGEKDEHIRGNN